MNTYDSIEVKTKQSRLRMQPQFISFTYLSGAKVIKIKHVPLGDAFDFDGNMVSKGTPIVIKK